jgi:hypothetical protein
MKQRMTIMILIFATAIISFSLGYVAHAKKKLSKDEIGRHLSELDGKEIAELVGKLEESWGISARKPATILKDDSGNTK